MRVYFLKLCWKNVWRNKRRTFLTVNAIGLGVMALVFLHNYYDTFHQQVIQNVIRYHSGHLAISGPGFEKNHATPLVIQDSDQVTEWLKKQDTVSAFSNRIVFSGMLSSAHGASNIALMGVDFDRESQVTQFAKKMIKGEFITTGSSKNIILGAGVAATLSAEVGSKVVVLTQGVDGSVGNELYFVSGIFETGSEIDKGLAFIPLKEAQSILSLPANASHQIAVVLKREDKMTEVKENFKKQVSPIGGIDIFSWKELQRPVVAMIELDRAVNRLLMFLILGVAAIGIANSILMSIMERTREFGVMLAIGTARREIVSMVIVETLLLTVVGVFIGNVFGILLTLFFHSIGFDLKWLTSNDFAVQGTLVQTISYPTVGWGNSLLVTAVILILSMLVSVVPARIVGRLSPMKALKSI